MFVRTWSGTRRLKSGASVAKCPTSSGLVALLVASSGIAQGHWFRPPPHTSGNGSPGFTSVRVAHVSPSRIGPFCGS